MQFTEAEALEQLRRATNWQKLIQTVNQCYIHAVKDPKILDMYASRIDGDELRKQIAVLEHCNFHLIPDEVKTKAGFFTAYILQSYARDKSYQEVIQYYFSILFNFKITHKTKKLFIKSVGKFRLTWQEQLGMFFENALFVALNMLQQLQTERSEGVLCQALKIESFNTIFTIEINWPEQREEVYHSLLVITKLLFYHLENEEQAFTIMVANILRKITQFILRDEFLQTQAKLIEELLNLWFQLLLENLEIYEDDQRLNQKKLQFILFQVSNWQDLFEGMVKTLQFYSPSIFLPELDLEIFNYLMLKQNMEKQNYYIIKQRAAQVLKILIEFNYKKKDILKIGIKYSQRIVWSIIHSLQSIAGSKHLFDVQQQKTCVQILSLLSQVLYTSVKINSEQIKHLFEEIILPLFQSYLDDIWVFYQKDPQMFSRKINDCCHFQKQKFMTSKIAQLIQRIEDYSEQSSDIVYGFVIKSLKVNKASVLSFASQSQLPERIIKNTTTLLLLSVLSYNTQKVQQYLQNFKQIFVLEYIAKLSQIEVALIYQYFCYVELEWFAQQDIVSQLIDSTLVSEMSPALRMFAIDLLDNINLDFFTQQQIFQFMHLYDLTDNKSTLHTVLHKLLTKRPQLFTTECIVQLIDSSISILDREFKSIIHAVQNKMKYSGQQAFTCLKICEQIANQESYLCHEQIVQKLWFLVESIQRVQYINFDDDLVRIGSYLLDNTKKLPQNLQVIQQVIEYFRKSQYNSTFYFQFFHKVYQICTQETLQVAYAVQNIIIEVVSVFMYHPNYRELTSENFVSLNESLWLTHSMLEQKISLQDGFWKDVKENISRFSILSAQISLPSALTIRFVNVRLAFAQKSRAFGQLNYIQDSSIFNYELICDFANRKKIYGYQAKLLVYNLTKLLPDIKCEGKPIIWIIMIYLLRNDHQKRNFYHNSIRIEDQDRKYHKLLSLIIPSIQLQETLGQQILLFVDTFKSKDMVNYFDSLNKLTQENQEELSVHLKKEINQRLIVKVGQIKINQDQQFSYRNKEEDQNTKSIFSSVDRTAKDSSRKRMKNFMFAQKLQASYRSDDQEEISLFTNAQLPLKKVCLDSFHQNYEFTESKRDLMRQRPMRNRKSRDFNID